MFPKNLRTRLRPLKVWVWAIVAPWLALLGRAALGLALQLSTASAGGLSILHAACRRSVQKRVKTRFLKAGSGPQERGFPNTRPAAGPAEGVSPPPANAIN